MQKPSGRTGFTEGLRVVHREMNLVVSRDPTGQRFTPEFLTTEPEQGFTEGIVRMVNTLWVSDQSPIAGFLWLSNPVAF